MIMKRRNFRLNAFRFILQHMTWLLEVNLGQIVIKATEKITKINEESLHSFF